MKYFLYCRKSSEDKKKQIQSIPDQIEWGEGLAQDRNIEIVDTLTDEQTGTKPGRKGFNEMMMRMQRGDADGIIVWKIDRLARNPIDEGTVKFGFMQGYVKHIVSSDREYREGDNQILMGVDFGAATQYSLELSRNVKRGMNSKVEKGHYPGKAPLGYLNDPYGIKGEKSIISDTERLSKLRKVFEFLLEGNSPAKALQHANEELLLRTKNDQKLKTSSFYRIITNRFYTGEFQWDGVWHKGEHEAVISKPSFENLQDIIHGRKYPTNFQHVNTFAKLIRCGECGSMITAEPPKRKIAKKTGEELVYYYHKCTKSNPTHKCLQKCVRRDDLLKADRARVSENENPGKLFGLGKKIFANFLGQPHSRHIRTKERFPTTTH
jgi:site-specific DNA recombinase